MELRIPSASAATKMTVVTVVALASHFTLAAQSMPAETVSVQTDEIGLRAMILNLVSPVYPKDSIRNNTVGVAVVQVTLDVHNRLTQVDTLQAPSASVASSVRTAIEHSTFSPPAQRDRNVSTIGKISFYFLKIDGKFQVLSPKDTPLFDSLVHSK